VAGAAAQETAPATGPAGGGLKTPQQAAAAYYRALLDEDGDLLLSCVDTQDPEVRQVVAARAAMLSASRAYRRASAAWGPVPAGVLPPAGNTALLERVAAATAAAVEVPDGAGVTLTPALGPLAAASPRGPAGGDGGELFRLRVVKAQEAWRVDLRGSGEMLRQQLATGARAAAEMTAAEARAIAAVAAEIDQGRITTAAAAAAAVKERTAAAQADLAARWKVEKAATRKAP
jgi:hypothetical protein